MTYRTFFISVFMIAIVGLCAWTTMLSYRPQQKHQTVQATNLPDAYMEDVTAIIIDKFGKTSMKIITPKLVHFAKSDTTELTTPKLILYRKSPQPWYITSMQAKATQGIENVNFWNNVIIHHPADLNNPETIIKTTTLMVHPNKKTAETKDLITMVQPNTTIKSNGMYADMNTGNINLSQARGEYEPTS